MIEAFEALNNKTHHTIHHTKTTAAHKQQANHRTHHIFYLFCVIIIHLLEIETDIHTVPTSYIYI